jgi:hypothetical protein
MDPFNEVQNTIQQVLPIVLLGPGVVLVGSGLFMWLGGLRWLKSIAAFTAALAGMLCAWYFTERQLVPMVLLPVILAGLGVYFHKTVVVLLGAALAAVLVLLVPVIVAGVNPDPAPVQAAPVGEEHLNLLDSIDRIHAKIRDGKQAVKDTIAAVPASRKQLAAGVGVVVCVMGLFSWRLVCAAACSVIGTTLIASGMTVLLLYKGAEPVKTAMQRPQLAALAVVGMAAGGVLIQLVLCPAKARNVTKDDIMKDLFNEGDKK